MQIVIEIPEQNYNDICNSETASNYSVLYALDGIRNGTPLPKGHGRLIDANAVDTRYSDPEVVETLDDAPTIIEADKESEE